MPRQERAFLANDAALVPGDAGGTKGGEKIGGRQFISCPPGLPVFGHADRYRIPHLRPGEGALGGKRAFDVLDGQGHCPTAVMQLMPYASAGPLKQNLLIPRISWHLAGKSVGTVAPKQS